MSRIPFPKVAQAAGVPNLARSAAVTAPTIGALALGAAETALWAVLQQGNKWGVFESKTGKALYSATPFGTSGAAATALSAFGGPTLSVLEVTYTKEMKTADFPVESGGFASYNKVETPATPTVTFGFTGSEAERKAFQDAVDAAVKSVTLYDIYTPEKNFTNHQVEAYRFGRTAEKGATLITITLMLKEVRQVTAVTTTATPVTRSAANPGATPSQSAGKVQPKTPAPSLLKMGADFLRGIF